MAGKSKAGKSKAEEFMAAPELPDKEVLTATDVKQRFGEEPFPTFGDSPDQNTRNKGHDFDDFYQELQVTGIDAGEIITPKILARLFYNASQHVGYQMTGKKMKQIFEARKGKGLVSVTTNASAGSSWTQSVDVTHNYTAALKMTSMEAAADVASPFCAFAAKMGQDMESQEIRQEDTYKMIKKFLAPMLSVAPMLPHKQIFIDEGDSKEAAVGLAPQFRADCTEVMRGIEASTKLIPMVHQLKVQLFQQYGDVYPSEYTIGVAAYGVKEIRVFNIRTMKVTQNFVRAAGKGKTVVNGIPVAGNVSGKFDEKTQNEEEKQNSHTEVEWSYIGSAAGAGSEFDAHLVLEHRLNPKQWAITQVTVWIPITELFPEEPAQRFKQVTDKYPEVMWKTVAMPTVDELYLVESANVSLNSVKNPGMVLSHWQKRNVAATMFEEFKGGVLSKCDHADDQFHIEDKEDIVYAMVWYVIPPVGIKRTPEHRALMRKQLRFIPKAENFQWVIEHDRRWGCDEDGTKIVALRLSWVEPPVTNWFDPFRDQRQPTFRYLSQIGESVQTSDVGFKEVQGGEIGDRLQKLTTNEHFTLKVISRALHTLNGVGNAVTIVTVNGQKFLTVEDIAKPLDTGRANGKPVTKKIDQNFLWTKYATVSKHTYHGELQGKTLKFQRNKLATDEACLFTVESGKVIPADRG